MIPLVRWRHDGYSGTGDDSDDIGLIRLETWSVAKSIPIYDGSPSSGQWLHAQGWGVTANGNFNWGTLRDNPYWNQSVKEVGTEYFRSLAVKNTRLCSGDSGTAIVTYAGSRIAAAGIASWATAPDGITGTFCAAGGKKMGHTRIRAKMQWIQNRLEQSPGGGCSEYGDYWLCK